MNLTNGEILQIAFFCIAILIGIGKYIQDIKNIKKTHTTDMEMIAEKNKLFVQRLCKTEGKIDKLETLIVDMKWLKKTMEEIKVDIKELKNK